MATIPVVLLELAFDSQHEILAISLHLPFAVCVHWYPVDLFAVTLMNLALILSTHAP